jgi:hypothetical protein
MKILFLALRTDRAWPRHPYLRGCDRRGDDRGLPREDMGCDDPTAELDAGPIWASREFALEADPPSKRSLYRGQVTEAAVRGTVGAVARIESGEFQSGLWQHEKSSDRSSYRRGCRHAPTRQADRAIDWAQDETATVVRKIRAADSAPASLACRSGMARMRKSASKVHPVSLWLGAIARSALAQSIVLAEYPI